MEELFARILLGHLIGDFLLQSKTMALRKSEKSLTGHLYCFIHCLVYTTSVSLMLWTANPFIIVLIFFSHWPIDRWSLANKWLKIIKGRDIATAFYSQEKYQQIDLIFSCVVYTVVDNTIHLILLWLIIFLI